MFYKYKDLKLNKIKNQDRQQVVKNAKKDKYQKQNGSL